MTAIAAPPSAYFTMHIGAGDPFWSRLISFWVEATVRATRGSAKILLATDIPEGELDISEMARDQLSVVTPDLDKYNFALGYHDGANAARFEALCFLRWFVAKDLLEAHQLESLCHLDNDLLLTTHQENLSCLGFVEGGSCSFSSVEQTGAFCATFDHIALCRFVDQVQEFFCFAEQHKLKRASDMQYLSWLAERGQVGFLNMAQTHGLTDGIDFVSNMRRYLIKHMEPQGDPGPITDHDRITFDQLLAHWPADAVRKHFHIGEGGGLTREGRPLQFIHFQGVAKAAYSPRYNNLYESIIQSL